ncbi:MAG TPA: hypothetical protein VLX29_03545 [Nitrospirota bacterium]|nr:hypothetical protein [Nitrospirota bacterium]
MDYQLIAIADACADGDDDVHRMLTGKIFPGQAKLYRLKIF